VRVCIEKRLQCSRPIGIGYTRTKISDRVVTGQRSYNEKDRVNDSDILTFF